MLLDISSARAPWAHRNQSPLNDLGPQLNMPNTIVHVTSGAGVHTSPQEDIFVTATPSKADGAPALSIICNLPFQTLGQSQDASFQTVQSAQLCHIAHVPSGARVTRSPPEDIVVTATPVKACSASPQPFVTDLLKHSARVKMPLFKFKLSKVPESGLGTNGTDIHGS